MLFTPRQLARHAEFFQRLGQFTSAGIGVIPALEHLQAAPPAAGYRAEAANLLTDLAAGRTLAQAMTRRSRCFPSFDTDLVEAGERSGRLDECFRLLAQHYEERSRIAGTAIRQLLYPAALLHIGVFLLLVVVPFARSQFSASLVGLLFHAVLALAPFYLLVAGLMFLLQGSRADRWGVWLEGILGCIPLLGSAHQSLALARLASALEALIGAGLNLVEAWEIGARASGSPSLRAAVADWPARLATGQTPAQLLRGNRLFPAKFSNLYATGEVTGTLQATLGQLHALYHEEGERKLSLFATLVPRLIYLVILLFLAYQILRSATRHYNQLEEIWKN